LLHVGDLFELNVKLRCQKVKMDLQEMGWKGMDWIDLAQDRDRWRALVNAVMELPGSIKCGEFLD
jgi:hypothetical protein